MIPKSISIIKKGMIDLVSLLNSYNWTVSDKQFPMLLSMVYYPLDNYRFTPNKQKIQIYKNGIIEAYINPKVIVDKESIINNLLDEDKNPLFKELGKIFDKGFTYRRYIEKITKQNPFLFSQDTTIQYQLLHNKDNYIDIGVNDILSYKQTNIFDMYDLLLPELEQLIRDEVSRIVDDTTKHTSTPVNQEKEEVTTFDYLIWKHDRKKKIYDKKFSKSAETDSPTSDIGKDDSGTEYGKEKIDPTYKPKRKLKRKS